MIIQPQYSVQNSYNQKDSKTTLKLVDDYTPRTANSTFFVNQSSMARLPTAYSHSNLHTPERKVTLNRRIMSAHSQKRVMTLEPLNIIQPNIKQQSYR